MECIECGGRIWSEYAIPLSYIDMSGATNETGYMHKWHFLKNEEADSE